MDPTSFTVGVQLEGLVGGSPVPRRRHGRGVDVLHRRLLEEFPDVAGDSLFTVLYYDGMQVILEALDQVDGNVDDAAAFQEALGGLTPRSRTAT